MLLRERPEAACSEDTSSGSFDLRSSRLTGIRAALRKTGVGDFFAKLKYHRKKYHHKKLDSLFICYNKLVCGSSSLVDGMQSLAIAKIGSIRNGKPLRFVFLESLRPSAESGIGSGFGWPLGGPSVAQGPPKRRPREAQASIWGSVFVCNENKKMAGWGLVSWERGQAEGCTGSPRSHVIADIAVMGKPLNHKGHPFDSPFASSGSLRPG